MEIKSVKVGNFKVIDNGTLFIKDGESAIIKFDNKTIITLTTQISGCNRCEYDSVGNKLSLHLMVRDSCVFEYNFSVYNADVQKLVIFIDATIVPRNITMLHYNIMAK